MRLTAALKKTLKNTNALPAPGNIASQPAPTGGWNARDPLPLMKPEDAVSLENYFPGTADVSLRGGKSLYISNMADAAETLMNYANPTSEEMWAAAGGHIYPASGGSSTPVATVSGLTNNRWQYTNASTSGGHFIIAVNGVDKMLNYDGTTWKSIDSVSTPAITGVDTTTLAFVFVYQHRVYLLENHALGFWYLPSDSVAGAANFFEFTAVLKKGGYVIAGGSWTRDSGDGMDDLVFFITSMGEVLIYSGNDPGTPGSFNIIGRYEISPPIGRRCLVKTGADMSIITIDGVVSIGNVISLDRAKTNKLALTDKIRNAFNSAAKLYRDSFGWEACVYPRSSMILFNIPVAENQAQEQCVMNSITSAWCKFTGWNARTFCVFNERLYYADNLGNIFLADDGNDDDGDPIQGFMQLAYSNYRSLGRQKTFQMVKALLFSGPTLSYGVSMAIDFESNPVPPTPSGSGESDAPTWDITAWDTSLWSSIGDIREWRGVDGVGEWGSIMFATSTIGMPINVSAFSTAFIVGGPL